MSYLNQEGDLRAKKRNTKGQTGLSNPRVGEKAFGGSILSPLLDDMGVVFEFTPNMSGNVCFVSDY